MPRDTGAEKNVFEVVDGLSGDVHEIFARQPTNRERAAYLASLFKRKGKKVIDNSFETRLRFGQRVCDGFTKGTFIHNGKVFASDPADPDYRPDWKEQLVKGAADVLVAMAFQVFEGTSRSMDEVDFETVDVDDLGDEGREKDKPDRAEGEAVRPLDHG